MVARRKKKYETGEAANFVTRKQAMQKLQLTLKVSALAILFEANLTITTLLFFCCLP